MATKTKSSKHPKSAHPITGRLDHAYSKTSPESKKVKKDDTDSCVLCGFDEAFHDLTEEDYTGTPEALASFEAAGGPVSKKG